MSDEEPKIIIDEGWKAQVERERETAAQKPDVEIPQVGEGEGEVQELSLFDNLVASLAAQAMMALGLVAPREGQQIMVDLGMANHLISTLAMIIEKTEGNISDDESVNIKEALSELSRVFGVRMQEADQAAMPGKGMSPLDLSPPS